VTIGTTDQRFWICRFKKRGKIERYSARGNDLSPIDRLDFYQ